MTAARTFTIERVDDREGLMSAEPAPRVEPMVYTSEDFDGTWAMECGAAHIPRCVTITLSRGTWNADEPVEVEGVSGLLPNGQPATHVEHIDVPATVDDEITLRCPRAFFWPPGVKITVPTQPAQPAAAADVDDFANVHDGPVFTLGVGDVHAPEGFAFADVRANSDGHVAVAFDDEHDDTLHMVRGERLGVPVRAVLAERTTAAVTVFIPAFVAPEEQPRAAREARDVREAINSASHPDFVRHS